MPKHSPFRTFKTSPEIIRLAVMLYVRFPLSLRNVEDLLHERGIDVSYETIRFWWNRAVQNLRQRPGENELKGRDFDHIGSGIWTRFSSKLTAKPTICGGP